MPNKKKQTCLLCRKRFDKVSVAQPYGKWSLCADCREVLKEKYGDIKYKERNGGYSKTAALIGLIAAVRKQAIIDHKLEDFEKFWLYSEKWSSLWELVQKSLDEHETLRNLVVKAVSK